MRLVSFLLVVGLAGCSTVPEDSASEDAGAPDASDAGSTDAGSIDAGPIDAGPIDAGSLDAGSLDAGSPDAGDAGTATSSVPGQCTHDADCPSGECNVRPPGGFCLMCGDDSDCPQITGVSYACSSFGSCNQECSRTSDCPPGLACSAGGLCLLGPCGASCPSPLVCDTGSSKCVRPSCSTAAECPGGVACSEGYCAVGG